MQWGVDEINKIQLYENLLGEFTSRCSANLSVVNTEMYSNYDRELILLACKHFQLQITISLIVSWWFTILQLGEIEHQLVKAPRAGCCYQSMLSVVLMFCTTSFPDLSKLYKLLRNIPRGLQAMVAELEEHITKTGRNLVTLYCCTNCTWVF